MKYVIGIDLGTSAVKTILVSQDGIVCHEISKNYPLIQKKNGYSEQDPEVWVIETINALTQLVKESPVNSSDIMGISYSGQMHGLVLLNKDNQVLRNAILWNDTRTTSQCMRITEEFGDCILEKTKNNVLEGFTLPKLLWVQENEPEIYKQVSVFLLPKDYLRYRMTGVIQTEFSDAAGTLLLNVVKKEWDFEICEKFNIQLAICPPLVPSQHCVGPILPSVAEETGLDINLSVYAGGADNACGAIGAGILSPGQTLCSIGTSGVILSFEENQKDYGGDIHFFNHVISDRYYSMGVTLAAGYSLSWFKEVFARNSSIQSIFENIDKIPAGANGLLFTPYIVGERTPYADSNIRGSFIGLDSKHRMEHFVKSIMEGITFSLYETIDFYRSRGKEIHSIVSIGGAAQNKEWLQMQADVFNARIIKLKNEQGPAMGAAIIAALGSGWFDSLEEVSKKFVAEEDIFHPNDQNVKKYNELYRLYKKIYVQTKEINEGLKEYRNTK